MFGTTLPGAFMALVEDLHGNGPHYLAPLDGAETNRWTHQGPRAITTVTQAFGPEQYSLYSETIDEHSRRVHTEGPFRTPPRERLRLTITMNRQASTDLPDPLEVTAHHFGGRLFRLVWKPLGHSLEYQFKPPRGDFESLTTEGCRFWVVRHIRQNMPFGLEDAYTPLRHRQLGQLVDVFV